MAVQPVKKRPTGTKLIDHALNDNGEYGLSVWQPENEFSEFYSLAFNAFKVDNTTFRKARIIKQQLLLNNYVGYDAIAGEWYKAHPIVNAKLLYPQKANFYYENGKIIERELSYEPNGKFYLIQGLAAPDTSYARIIHNHTDLMFDCDIAIRQNLNATKAPQFVAMDDPDTALSIKQAIQEQQAGQPIIVVAKNLIDNYKSIPLNTPVTFPTIYEFRQKIRDSLLNKLATLTANTEKRERVQSAEVNAGVGECEDYIYSFLDNVNEQLESYGLRERLVNNTSLEELFTDEEDNNEEEQL